LPVFLFQHRDFFIKPENFDFLKIYFLASSLLGALSFFGIRRSPEIVKKSVKARAGALASDERLLLDEVVAAFQASTGLPLALVKDPGGRGQGAG
jgi:hypothetical protein